MGATRRATLVLSLMILLCLAGTGHAGPAETVSLEACVTVYNTGDTVVRYARVEIPLIMPATSYGTVVDESYSLEPADFTVLPDGQRIGRFMIRNLAPGESRSVAVSYLIEPGAVDPDQHLSSETQLEHDHDIRIARIAWHLTYRRDTVAARMRALQSFTRTHITYDASSPFRNGGALTALQHGEGVCEDFAALLVSLARAAGIEARMVYGYYRSPRTGNWERHAWAEYVDDCGRWVATDPTLRAEPGLNPHGLYVAQWHTDRSIRVAYVGSTIGVSFLETMADEWVTPEVAAATTR